MALKLNSMTIQEFISLQGIKQPDENILMKKYAGSENKSYADWYNEIGQDFELSEMKNVKELISKKDKETE